MSHRNAPLTETGRLRLARCVVEEGWPLRRAAERFQVSPTTAQRWAAREFTSRRVAALRPRIQQITDELLDAASARAGCAGCGRPRPGTLS